MTDSGRLVKERPLLTGFFFAYYLGLVAYGVATGATQTIFYAVFVAGGALLVLRLYAKYSLSALVLWGLAAWGFAHMVGGLIEIGGAVVYEHSLGGGQLRFDKVVHFFGFGFATLVAFELLQQTIGRTSPRRSVAIAAFFTGLGVGAINETIEFLITLLPGDSNVGGFSNTGWDLVANTAGAATAALISGMGKRQSTG